MISTATQQHRHDRQRVADSDSTDQRAVSGDIVLCIENHLESWRQITHFIGLARGKRFDVTDEDQFLELKGVIVQELEMILAGGECSSPTKDNIHTMMNNVPSLRSLSQLNEGALRNLELQWHLIYIGWHATLGQLKAKNRTLDALHPKSGLLHWWSSR